MFYTKLSTCDTEYCQKSCLFDIKEFVDGEFIGCVLLPREEFMIICGDQKNLMMAKLKPFSLLLFRSQKGSLFKTINLFETSLFQMVEF